MQTAQINRGLHIKSSCALHRELFLNITIMSRNLLHLPTSVNFHQDTVSHILVVHQGMLCLCEFIIVLGQLNAYVGYYKKNEMIEGDNPPVGILLCTDKGSQMVEYALSGMDNQLFVSTYMLHLPDKKKLEEFMLKEIEEMGM